MDGSPGTAGIFLRTELLYTKIPDRMKGFKAAISTRSGILCNTIFKIKINNGSFAYIFL